MSETVQDAAREALGSACGEVRDAGPDDAVDGVQPRLVALPGSTDETAEVMRAAAGHGLTVVARGRGTKVGWGVPPRSADLVVDLSRMDRVLDHAAGDLIVDTQAGTPLATVRGTVAEKGQRLVIDETVAGGSIGGALATGAAGPRRLLVGSPRDLLIGITVVRADGVVAKAGGRVVKNVAGYDLGKLLIGSLGTLGVITEAVFRLHPVPAAERYVAAQVPDADTAHRLAQSVVHAQVVPTAVEVDLGADGSGVLVVELGGREDAVEARASTVSALLGGDTEVTDTEPDGWAAYPWAPAETGLKLTCRLSAVGDVLRVAAEVGARVKGSAGTGVLYAALPAGADARTALERLREVCTTLGGAAVVVDAPAEVKQGLDVWGPVPALDLMRRVKDQFDPDHRLSPGRFVGGI